MNSDNPILTREELLDYAARNPLIELTLTFCLRESNCNLAMRANMTPASLIVGYDYSHILTFLQQIVAANTLPREELRALLGMLEQRVPIAPRTNISEEVNPNKRRLEV